MNRPTLDEMQLGPLIIRADAGPEIGSGHVMRCLGLAEAWRNANGRVVFALARGATELDNRLRSACSEIVSISAEPGSADDAIQTRELCRSWGASWLVVDGFRFSSGYCVDARTGVSRLLLVDDHGERPSYQCDIVVNLNPQAADRMYTRRDAGTRLLLGPHYALVRREFLSCEHKSCNVSERARQILITFGGADPHNVTLRAFQALQRIHDLPLDITVIVGASNPHGASLKTAISCSRHAARLLVSVDNMAEVMTQSDLAVTAGGGTCYELAYMKVPMFLITMAKNHERTIEAYREARAAVAGGWFDALTEQTLADLLRSVIGDQQLRQKLLENAGRMVDGRGAERVVETMRAISQNEAHGQWLDT